MSSTLKLKLILAMFFVMAVLFTSHAADAVALPPAPVPVPDSNDDDNELGSETTADSNPVTGFISKGMDMAQGEFDIFSSFGKS